MSIENPLEQIIDTEVKISEVQNDKEKIPQFIKEFSKEKSSEERDQVAETIKIRRAEYFSNKKTEIDRRNKLEQNTEERERELEEKLQSINKLKDKLNELSVSGLNKLLNYFQFKKIESDVTINQKKYDELKGIQDSETTEQQKILQKLSSKKIPPELKEAKDILNDFYKDQEEKWTKSEYTKEDIEKYFSEEHLASLPIEDYVLLLKRFPGEMVAHVTRQGIRDHVGHIYHTIGQGAYSNSFMKMVEDGRLRSPLGVYLIEKEKEKAIARFLNLDKIKNKEEAAYILDSLCGKKDVDPENSLSHGDYSDSMAIHFATEGVADDYYGSEKGNEIFIVYPSAHIASQYYFAGQLNQDDKGYHNDQWVWANEEKGMDLNAGIIFIPGETKVNKDNGSRYELDGEQNPIKNESYHNIFRNLVTSPDFINFAEQILKTIGKFPFGWNRGTSLTNDEELLKEIEPFCKKLEQSFGIIDKRFQSAILNYSNLQTLIGNLKNLKEAADKDKIKTINSYIDDNIENSLREKGILFLEAKETVSSKEFWEEYFRNIPNKKPSKIIYYEGLDPTAAFLQWREEQGINKKAKDRSIGFSERRVSTASPQAESGINRFRNLAEKTINDYFDEKKLTTA